LLPLESSQDYAAQLLPSLLTLGQIDSGVWGRARAEFQRHTARS
jgi:saccharopine dehydrogenase (NAD+, L-lysine-forming)